MKGVWKLLYPKQQKNIVVNFDEKYARVYISSVAPFSIEYKILPTKSVKFTHRYPFSGVVVSPFRITDEKMFFQKNFIVPLYSHETNLIFAKSHAEYASYEPF
jgi:hypothetical protein